MAINHGSKRHVVGAHYGFASWLGQRVTGVAMAVFTLVLLVHMLLRPGEMTYDKWSAIFSAQWMKVLTFTVIISIAYHAWVGMRDIWMDYVKPVGMRLVMHVLTIVWLVGCAGWAVQVLWRL